MEIEMVRTFWQLIVKKRAIFGNCMEDASTTSVIAVMFKK
jgi:hypothetical protein